MKWRNITPKDLHQAARKLSLEPTRKKRRSPHPVFWYVLDDKKVLRITLPNQHGGSGSLSTGFIKQVQNSFRLSTQQFEALVECPLSAEEFETILRRKLGL